MIPTMTTPTRKSCKSMSKSISDTARPASTGNRRHELVPSVCVSVCGGAARTMSRVCRTKTQESTVKRTMSTYESMTMYQCSV